MDSMGDLGQCGRTESREFIHKKLFGAVGGFLSGGPLGAARGFVTGGGRKSPGPPPPRPTGRVGGLFQTVFGTRVNGRSFSTGGGRPFGNGTSQLHAGGAGGAGGRPIDPETGLPMKRRRMNVVNPRALRRATRRVNGFVKVATRALEGTGWKVVRRTTTKKSSPKVIVESGPGSVVV